jgi:hypothetical protein
MMQKKLPVVESGEHEEGKPGPLLNRQARLVRR